MTTPQRRMPLTRLYTGDDQQSHFEDLEIELDDGGVIGHLSQRYPASAVIFRYTDGDYDYDWHNAPQRQYIVLLDGALDVTVGDGTTRRFEAGDVLLAEDLEGRGHVSRSVDGKPRKSLFITID